MKRLKSSNQGFYVSPKTYIGELVERFWKLLFRPLEVSGSLGIAELPSGFAYGELVVTVITVR